MTKWDRYNGSKASNAVQCLLVIFSLFFCWSGEGVDKDNSPLRVQTVVTKTKFTVPDSVLLNGGKLPPKVEIIEPEQNSKTSNRIKRTKSRDQPNGMKPRPKKLSTHRLSACSMMSEQLSSAMNGFPPTPLESSAFIMPSPKENFFPGHNGMPQAPLLTPPVSPAVATGLPRNVMGNNNLSQVTYTALGEKRQQQWGYAINGDVNPSSEVIDSLVAQHFNNCGLGGFVAPTRYQAPTTNESCYMNNVRAAQFLCASCFHILPIQWFIFSGNSSAVKFGVISVNVLLC